jgi:DNA-binding response OmpR family regulator
MGQTTIQIIAKTTDLIVGNTEIYSDLKSLLANDDIQIRQSEHWQDVLSYSDTEKPELPHLIILNCPGSGVDALAMCQEVRSRYSGLLVLVSENEDERFHVLALDLGADASLPSIAGAPLVAANLKAMLRRFAPATPPSVLNFGKLTVDANQREVFVAGQAAQLSTFEFQLIWYLAQQPGCVVARDEIYRELRHSAYNGYDRSIDVYVSRIRQKIGDDSTSPQYLKTVRGVGYQFVCVEN